MLTQNPHRVIPADTTLTLPKLVHTAHGLVTQGSARAILFLKNPIFGSPDHADDATAMLSNAFLAFRYSWVRSLTENARPHRN